METKIEIKSISGEVLFSYEAENNTLYKTVCEANLCEANLREADLRGADLPIFCKWSYSINLEKKEITIGCKTKNIADWDIFFNSQEEYSTKRNSEEFKFIEATYLASKAYMNHLLEK